MSNSSGSQYDLICDIVDDKVKRSARAPHVAWADWIDPNVIWPTGLTVYISDAPIPGYYGGNGTAGTASDYLGGPNGVGTVGPQGPAGADGADGADGAQGPQGPQGDPGPQGPAGSPGTNPALTAALVAVVVAGTSALPASPTGNDGRWELATGRLVAGGSFSFPNNDALFAGVLETVDANDATAKILHGLIVADAGTSITLNGTGSEFTFIWREA